MCSGADRAEPFHGSPVLVFQCTVRSQDEGRIIQCLTSGEDSRLDRLATFLPKQPVPLAFRPRTRRKRGHHEEDGEADQHLPWRDQSGQAQQECEYGRHSEDVADIYETPDYDLDEFLHVPKRDPGGPHYVLFKASLFQIVSSGHLLSAIQRRCPALQGRRVSGLATPYRAICCWRDRPSLLLL